MWCDCHMGQVGAWVGTVGTAHRLQAASSRFDKAPLNFPEVPQALCNSVCVRGVFNVDSALHNI